MERQRVSAIVLAGGRSSRFGGDKLAAMVEGRPLLHHAIAAVAQVADEVIVVVAAGRTLDLPPSDVPPRIVEDTDPFGGPLAGLRDGAAAATHATLLLVGGDMPALRPPVLRLLVEAVQAGAAAAVLDHEPGATRRPTMPIALSRDPAHAGAVHLVQGGERSLRALIDALDAAVVPAAAWRELDPSGETLRDVDRPEDLPDAHRPPAVGVDSDRSRSSCS